MGWTWRLKFSALLVIALSGIGMFNLERCSKDASKSRLKRSRYPLVGSLCIGSFPASAQDLKVPCLPPKISAASATFTYSLRSVFIIESLLALLDGGPKVYRRLRGFASMVAISDLTITAASYTSGHSLAFFEK
jgi:hypothetical protein